MSDRLLTDDIKKILQDEILEYLRDCILPQYCRFADFRSAKLVTTWPQLERLIDEYGFPPGKLISPNTRIWEVSDVLAWVNSKPEARKQMRRKKQDQQLEVA